MPADMELQMVASLLRRGRTLDQLSTGLTLLGVLFGLLQLLLITPVALGLILSAWLIVVGLLQKYWALRVAFDAELFELVARDADALPDRTQALDQALQNLGLQPANRAGRPWAERQRGALKLLRNQAVLLAAQVLPTLAVILASPWLSFTG
ncbi:hypothetical protein [Pseudomonas sp. 10S4]|uniref:hypothetical protein n=1 Tax=Pseudomonas sp. 10S4 TaxID=3048583 RepID=UPI002AC8E517|nr:MULTISPECIES: hypothetical protein [unclassified Pseudomonas]MEB0222802.1 hypothetical protein [Pseudomonas sp. 5S1]MEB0292967.1 hypothetical protein [Pseudomonas sp. 10S4]WPX19926.1 hypothetical protein RHM58_08175 [Pseudomonas sp. 10S4]